MKQKSYWPDGLTMVGEFRKFYVANDLSYCGFAQNEREIGKKHRQMNR